MMKYKNDQNAALFPLYFPPFTFLLSIKTPNPAMSVNKIPQIKNV